jgi:hypothetical protein
MARAPNDAAILSKAPYILESILKYILNIGLDLLKSSPTY